MEERYLKLLVMEMKELGHSKTLMQQKLSFTSRDSREYIADTFVQVIRFTVDYPNGISSVEGLSP